MEKEGKIARPKTRSRLKVAKITPEQIEQLQSDNDLIREVSLLSYMDQSLEPLPKENFFRNIDRAAVEKIFHAGFMLVGGVPHLKKWIEQNPTEFYKLYGKLLNQDLKGNTQATQIVINSPFGKSELDLMDVPAERTSATEQDFEDDE